MTMGLFGRKKDKAEIRRLKKENAEKSKRIKELENLCDVKDSYFKEIDCTQ